METKTRCRTIESQAAGLEIPVVSFTD